MGQRRSRNVLSRVSHTVCRQDGFARMEDSLRWVHGAGRVLGAERRLLEVCVRPVPASSGLVALPVVTDARLDVDV